MTRCKRIYAGRFDNQCMNRYYLQNYNTMNRVESFPVDKHIQDRPFERSSIEGSLNLVPQLRHKRYLDLRQDHLLPLAPLG